MWSNVTLAHAVDAAARCAAVDAATCGTTANIQSYAASQAWSLGLLAAAFVPTNPACGYQVTGTMNFVFVIPWFYGTNPFGAANAMPLNATACYP